MTRKASNRPRIAKGALPKRGHEADRECSYVERRTLFRGGKGPPQAMEYDPRFLATFESFRSGDGCVVHVVHRISTSLGNYSPRKNGALLFRSKGVRTIVWVGRNSSGYQYGTPHSIPSRWLTTHPSLESPCLPRWRKGSRETPGYR